MAERVRAEERLERLLYILPTASVDGGAAIEDLARVLGVSGATILDDLTEVTSRSYYHPAGSGDDIQIHIEADRVSVWTTGAFRRPVKLGPAEAFCIALGLRQRGRSAPEALLRRVEAHLAAATISEEALRGIHARDLAPDPDGMRDVLVDGARHHLCCRIRYLKPAETEPEVRTIRPHAVVHAEGHWYVVGWCETSAGARAFRLDRILDAELLSRTFDPADDDVDLDAFLQEGRVYHAHEEMDVTIRYSPVVRRWIEEWAPEGEAQDDGSLLVQHRIADPEWVVRHVLAYGGEAEVTAPEEVRALVGGVGGADSSLGAARE